MPRQQTSSSCRCHKSFQRAVSTISQPQLPHIQTAHAATVYKQVRSAWQGTCKHITTNTNHHACVSTQQREEMDAARRAANCCRSTPDAATGRGNITQPQNAHINLPSLQIQNSPVCARKLISVFGHKQGACAVHSSPRQHAHSAHTCMFRQRHSAKQQGTTQQVLCYRYHYQYRIAAQASTLLPRTHQVVAGSSPNSNTRHAVE
ncbi:hypothetical protein COO60DRAFT_636930 [Scenedesmus sp. NREL 46B-D3]|nr:hypothetical protein COO60DRAFT_636930 [Scenedesmus sp. NREL 46B-D3]